jgi:hypothetical protein
MLESEDEPPHSFSSAHQTVSVTSQYTCIFSKIAVMTSYIARCLIVLLWHVEMFGRFGVYLDFLSKLQAVEMTKFQL